MINERIEKLREVMRRESIDAFIFPSTDPHNGEYVPDHWKGREWISGFNGSAGTAVVTLHEAALWTDSRYFLAAEEQLKGTEFTLMRERIPGTPSIKEWVARKLAVSNGTTVGIDGMVMSAADINDFIDHFQCSGITVRHNFDPLATIWTDRPSIPLGKVEVQPQERAGESVGSKIERIRQCLHLPDHAYHFVTALDDIAWTLNLRGSDVHCCPVFVSYLLIGKDDVTLFVDDTKLTPEVVRHLKNNNIKVRAYEDAKSALQKLDNVWMDPTSTCFTLYNAPQSRSHKQQAWTSPIPTLKIMKNATEIAGYHSAMLKDGIAMVKFLHWLDTTDVSRESEISIDEKLTALRAEQPGFRGLSFDTIAGYQEHGAIVHYEATPATDMPLRPEGLLLLDSGAHYEEGTTDITRTIPLGPLTDEQRHIYTLILKGHIDLAMAKFPDGASGTQIDVLARQHIWREGLNYLHGTGHGVGSYLNVHEGPHQIRMEWKPQPLRAGMTVTNEPGLYLAGRFGVRIENTMLITDYTETDFGKFLQLEPLTLCPISTKPIIRELMTAEETAYLNSYHQHVCETLLPHLQDEDERQWLVENTKAI